jgi:soluble lytic murein transglycosylase
VKPLEGAIYAETIPFSETRDYVKKVMANAVFYSAVLGKSPTPIKQRLSTVPARAAGDPIEEDDVLQ